MEPAANTWKKFKPKTITREEKKDSNMDIGQIRATQIP